MPYHPSRPVTSPSHYIETSSSLSGEEPRRLEWAPLLPSRLNGARRRSKSEMFDLLAELGMDEAVLDESSVLDDALSLSLEKLQLLDQVRIILVELSVSVDVGEEPPVIEVVDGVLEDGIRGSVAPEAAAKPGGEGFKGFVRCIIGRGI